MKIVSNDANRPIYKIYDRPKQQSDEKTDADTKAAPQDSVEISPKAMQYYKDNLTQNDSQKPDDDTKLDKAETESTSVGGSVGINAGKLARMLAAAKTRAQVQSVMALIENDLKECDQGKAQGLEVDEASIAAAKKLLQQAKTQLSAAENREATPEEEMASAIASLL